MRRTSGASRRAFKGENFAKNLGTVDKVEENSKRKNNARPAQLALAWFAGSRSAPSCPSPGTTSAARLKENLAAADITLNAADLAPNSRGRAERPSRAGGTLR